ncbi:hypothetical protein [uncultured Paenibacillus sp.]|uniref:hypothetical protein n=1 Tax=uncultured Paenibacillus sp. TaxID=227322 RepID=UPI0015A911E6|nr:hypothetical protein [uncultured Paenibacillus sp.]
MFGEAQYKEAFIVNEVNVSKKDFGFTVPSGTKRIGVMVGYKDNEVDIDRKASYTILDSKGTSVASGKVEDGKVLSNEIVANGETELKSYLNRVALQVQGQATLFGMRVGLRTDTK